MRTALVVPVLLLLCSAAAWPDSESVSERPRPGELKLTLDAGITSAVSAELLKLAFRDPRPSGSGYGFPSGHTAVAFALARVMSEYHPRQKWLWYAIAVRVAWSRVKVDAHDWDDVIGGAALGSWVGDTAVSRGGMVLKSWEW